MKNIDIVTLNCNSCGGSLDKDNNCTYCGNRHKVTIKEDLSRFKQGGDITPAELIKFEVERVNGKIKFTPEQLEVKKTIGLVRVQSNKPMLESVGTFTYNGFVHSLHAFFSAYGLQTNISDVDFKNTYLVDISGFNFDGLKDEKLTVTLYPIQKPNISSYKPPTC